MAAYSIVHEEEGRTKLESSWSNRALRPRVQPEYLLRFAEAFPMITIQVYFVAGIPVPRSAPIIDTPKFDFVFSYIFFFLRFLRFASRGRPFFVALARPTHQARRHAHRERRACSELRLP